MSYLHEREANNVVARIRSMLPAEATVVRGGAARSVPSTDLVPGDVIRLRLGARVPADLRLIFASGLKVEIASLTGESEPVECGLEAVSDVPIEARNIVFSSSFVTGGEGLGVVIKTGDDSLIGTISHAAAAVNTTGSSMEREVGRVVAFVGVLALVTGSILCVHAAASASARARTPTSLRC